MPPRTKTHNLVLNMTNATIECTACGQSHQVEASLPLATLMLKIKAALTLHSSCKPKE